MLTDTFSFPIHGVAKRMNVEKIGDVSVISADERLDAIHGPQLKNLITELVKESRFKVVIDMGQTTLMDSTGCGGLVSCLRTMLINSGDIRLARPTQRVLEILQLTRLHRAFEIHESVESAIRSFQ